MIHTLPFGNYIKEKSNNFVHYDNKLFTYFSTLNRGDFYVCKEAFTIIRVVHENTDDVQIVLTLQASKEESEWNLNHIRFDAIRPDMRCLTNVVVKLNT